MASSSKTVKDEKVGSYPAGVPVHTLPEQYVYNEVIGANRYEPLMLERCFKNEAGECEIIRLIGLWDKCDNEWVRGYPCAVDIKGDEWCGDKKLLRPVFGNKPSCRGPIPGPPGIQGLQGIIGLTGPSGPTGVAGPSGPVGPESSCDTTENCPIFAFDQTSACQDEWLATPFINHSQMGTSPGLGGVTGSNFNPSKVPSSTIGTVKNLVDYTNNTECRQEMVCSIESGNEIGLTMDRGSTMSIGIWAENEAGALIPQSFQKFTHEPPIGGDGITNTKNFPLVSTPWTIKLNPGESTKTSFKVGLLAYTKPAEYPSSAATFYAKVAYPCISCKVTTVGPAA